MDVPVHWLSYCYDNPERGRWDQLFIERCLAGDEGHPPYGVSFHDATPQELASNVGRVIVFPCGHYAECGSIDMAFERLRDYVNELDWALVIATSDECQAFPWERFDALPEHMGLWVQLGRPDKEYPFGTRFFGEGPPVSARDQNLDAVARDLDVFFSGQGGHERRDQFFAAARNIDANLKTRIARTGGFTQGLPHEEYLHTLARSWVAPAPAGICSPSSFRAFEALEAGCIPILDNGNVTSDFDDTTYWELIGMDGVAPTIDYWRDLPTMVDSLLVNRCETAARCSSRWQQYKRRLLQQLNWDVLALHGDPVIEAGPWDMITVIIPTSPVPSNPSLEMIQNTVQSIRIDLPGAEILITCDGVRDEQLDRADDYHVFLHRLCMWTNTQHNVWPIISPTHRHQSGMMFDALSLVRTHFVLYVEHDAPLEGVIPWADVLRTMADSDLNSMRFLHETHIPPGSELLFLDHAALPAQEDTAPFVRTIQWSQRPHLARTDWYRRVMFDHFDPEARTFIEDVMHGVVQAGTYAGRKRALEAWERWRMAVYAPEGSWKRSGHYNGRAEDPKFPMYMKYPNGQRPEGAPPEGWQ